MKSLLHRIPDPLTRQSLRQSAIDGVLWALMFGWSEHYIIPLVIFFKAGPFFVSLLTGLNQLSISLFQFLGVPLVRRYRHRRMIAIIGNQLQALSWLLILLVAWRSGNIWIIMLLFVLGTGAINAASPGWFSWMNDIVPPLVKGEFWGKRNRIIGLTQLVAIVTGGMTLYFSKSRLGNEWIGFVVLITLAVICRSLSYFPMAATHEPPMTPTPPARYLPILSRVKRFLRSNFGRFIFFAILTNFAVNILAVLLPIQFLNVLHFNYLLYTLVTLLPVISLQVSMSFWGPLTDRLGNYKIMRIGAFGTIFIALFWVFAHHPLSIILLQLLSGFMLAAFNLSCQNFIFESARREHVPSSMALYNGLINICAFLGSLTGGLLARITPSIGGYRFSELNLEYVFLVSFLVRGAIFILFIGTFREVRRFTARQSHSYTVINYPTRGLFTFLRRLGDKTDRDHR
ncbi:MAG: MFS transporter [Candidatus Delongbacteria bacterium]|nr:MFS transporter [Candidatus Delongbacteria bacterium]